MSALAVAWVLLLATVLPTHLFHFLKYFPRLNPQHAGQIDDCAERWAFLPTLQHPDIRSVVTGFEAESFLRIAMAQPHGP